MIVEKDNFISLEYTLFLENGEIVERTPPEAPFEFIYQTGQVLPGLEKGIAGMRPGETSKISVKPTDGYGMPKDELIRKIPRTNFPDDAEFEIESMYRIRGPQGVINFKIKHVDDLHVTADFNHPLAGKNLLFDVKVIDVRKPTDEDIQMILNRGCGRDNCCESDCDK